MGISVDSAPTHKAHAEKYGLSIHHLADFHPKGAVGEQYGVFVPERGFDGRAAFVIDENGIVRFAKIYELPQKPDLNEIFDVLKGL